MVGPTGLSDANRLGCTQWTEYKAMSQTIQERNNALVLEAFDT